MPLGLRLLVSPQVDMDVEAGRNGSVRCPGREEDDFELSSSRYLASAPIGRAQFGLGKGRKSVDGFFWRLLWRDSDFPEGVAQKLLLNRLRKKRRLASKVPLPHLVRCDSMNICVV